jgi:peptide/nickel transport system permease protein
MTEATAEDWGTPLSDRSQLNLFARQFRRNRTAVVGVVLVVIIVSMAVFAPLVAPYDPYLQVYTETLQAPSAKHPMGTDDLGRDQMSRVIYGARVSLPIGVISMAMASIVGVLLGLTSGFYGGRTDSVIMRIMDALLAFPGLLLAIFLAAVLGPSLRNAMIGIVIVYIPSFARVTRANVLSTKEEEYIVAARSIGASNWRVMSRHVLLNISSPIIVQVSLGIGLAILIESSLSFLGLGVQPPTPAWGSMISQGRQFITKAWWLMVFPGMAIFFTVLAFNYVGDGLREAFDPRQRRA